MKKERVNLFAIPPKTLKVEIKLQEALTNQALSIFTTGSSSQSRETAPLSWGKTPKTN
jgi:hypothetical protein